MPTTIRLPQLFRAGVRAPIVLACVTFLCLVAIFSVSPSYAIEADEQHEVIRWNDGTFDATAMPFVVTSSLPPTGGDRLTIPGNPASSSSVDVDGVARLFIDSNPTPGFGSLCSGTLLEGGRFLLTAAHCVTNTDGTPSVIDGADGNFITFELSSGNVTVPFSANDVIRHPSYSGDVLDGFDVALIDLGSPLSSDIPRYKVNTDVSIEGLPNLAVGYGLSGDGNTGTSGGSGLKRTGLNNFDSLGLPVGGITNQNTQLTADYDSGLAANDAFDVLFNATGGIADLGFGADEVGIAPGDSGGPTFIIDNGEPFIAGVHSYGLRLEFNNGSTSDVDLTLNSSFGEFYVDARVADPAVLSFITSTIAIPEPSAAMLLISSVMLSIGKRRRVA